MKAIVARQVVKQYKKGARALAGLSLSVEQGEIFTLIGPNGAGKSTLIHILSSGMEYDAGEIRILGKDMRKERAAVRGEIACAYQRTALDGFLSAEENMLFHGRLYRIPGDEAKRRTESLIGAFGLDRYRACPAGLCPGGIRRRIDIALRMMTEPKILILDEPTVGMDIRSRLGLWDMIRRIRDEMGVTVFLTTHYLEEARRLSDHICIMKEGKEVVQGPPDMETDLEEVFLQLTDGTEG